MIASEGQRLGQTDDGVLGGCLGQAVVPVGEQARGRSRVDDVAAALSEQHRKEHEVAPHDAEEVDVDDPLPRVERDVLDGTDGKDADVVHDDVHRPETLQGEIAGRLKIGHAGDVARGADSRTADRVRDGQRPIPSTSLTTTRAPRLASEIADARPMPLPAPVTTATALERSTKAVTAR